MTNMDYGRGMARQPDDPGRRSARAGARTFGQQLEDAVRENPVPAALIGMGCLWMLMGGSRLSAFWSCPRRVGFRRDRPTQATPHTRRRNAVVPRSRARPVTPSRRCPILERGPPR